VTPTPCQSRSALLFAFRVVRPMPWYGLASGDVVYFVSGPEVFVGYRLRGGVLTRYTRLVPGEQPGFERVAFYADKLPGGPVERHRGDLRGHDETEEAVNERNVGALTGAIADVLASPEGGRAMPNPGRWRRGSSPAPMPSCRAR
jgi:hypothetical protein